MKYDTLKLDPQNLDFTGSQGPSTKSWGLLRWSETGQKAPRDLSLLSASSQFRESRIETVSSKNLLAVSSSFSRNSEFLWESPGCVSHWLNSGISLNSGLKPWGDLYMQCLILRGKLLQLCLTLCEREALQPGFSVYGVLQARILEQVAMGSSWPWGQTLVSGIWLHW